MNDFPEVMTIEQVAEYLQLHPQVVYRHVKAGTLPASRIGRTIRFKKSVLDAFLENDGWAAVQKILGDDTRARGGSATVSTKHHTMASRASATTGKSDPEPAPPDASNRFTADVD